MKRPGIDPYIKICMKTWLLCEANIHAEATSPSPRFSLIQECSHCATACFETAYHLVSSAGNVGQLALNAMLRCRQCAMECAKYAHDKDVLFCGEVCSVCGDALQDISYFSLN